MLVLILQGQNDKSALPSNFYTSLSQSKASNVSLKILLQFFPLKIHNNFSSTYAWEIRFLW